MLALSAAAAAVSLVLLVALLAPPPDLDAASRAAAPAPTATAGTVMMIDSGATRVTLEQVSRLPEDMTSTVCVAAIGSNSFVHLVFDPSGQLLAAYSGGTTGRFIPLRPDYWGPFRLTVPCDTSDVFAPRINRAR